MHAVWHAAFSKREWRHKRGRRGDPAQSLNHPYACEIFSLCVSWPGCKQHQERAPSVREKTQKQSKFPPPLDAIGEGYLLGPNFGSHRGLRANAGSYALSRFGSRNLTPSWDFLNVEGPEPRGKDRRICVVSTYCQGSSGKPWKSGFTSGRTHN